MRKMRLRRIGAYSRSTYPTLRNQETAHGEKDEKPQVFNGHAEHPRPLLAEIAQEGERVTHNDAEGGNNTDAIEVVSRAPTS